MSHLAKVQWTFAAKNARSAMREGLWVGVSLRAHCARETPTPALPTRGREKEEQ
jgi:hypothetical protein